jgi:REP-associated tyrosine transposase
MHSLKLSFVKKLRNRFAIIQQGPFWQARGYDRNIRNAKEFDVKIDYIHNNPVKRGLVKRPEDWKWSSYRHYAFRDKGIVEIESEWTARYRESQKMGTGPRTFLMPLQP